MPAEMHETSLIALLAIGFVLALLFGLLANMLRVSPIVGYLLAGIAVGPFTPGFVADAELARQLAEIGVILLMFGVGMHFSLARPAGGTGASPFPARWRRSSSPPRSARRWRTVGLGARRRPGVRLALSVASTVVLLRALEDARACSTRQRPHRGRLADRRGPRHGAGAGAAAGAAPDVLGGEPGAAHGTGGRRCSADARAHPRQGRGVRRADARRRRARRALAAAAGRAHRLARAVHAVPCWRSRSASPTARRRCSASRSRSAPSSPAWSSASPSSATRPPPTAAAAGRLRRAVLRVGRHAVRPDDPGARAAGGARGRSRSSSSASRWRRFSSCSRSGYPVRTALTVSAGLAQIGEFSFILAEPRPCARPAARRGRDLILAGALLSIALNPLLLPARRSARRMARGPAGSLSWRCSSAALRREASRAGAATPLTLRQPRRPGRLRARRAAPSAPC